MNSGFRDKSKNEFGVGFRDEFWVELRNKVKDAFRVEIWKELRN